MVKVFFLSICLMQIAFGKKILEGEVHVLEAPIFHTRNSEAPIVQLYRKGDKLKLHPIHDHRSPHDRDYIEYTNVNGTEELKGFNALVNYQETTSKFYKTFDRNGRIAYIQKKHVKVIYNDQRERLQPLSMYRPDKTDYRITEPLPEKYPIIKPQNFRATILYGAGAPSTYSYGYELAPTKTYDNFSNNISLMALRRAVINNDTRLYFGGEFQASMYMREAEFANNFKAEERIMTVGMGPTLAYDIFIGEESRLSFSGSLIVNLIDQYSVKAKNDLLEQYEVAVYRSITMTPEFKLLFYKTNWLDFIDFVAGPSIHIQLPQDLSVQVPADSNRTLNAKDSYKKEFALELGGYFGIHKAL